MRTAEESREMPVEQENSKRQKKQWSTEDVNFTEEQEDQGKDKLSLDDYRNDQEMRQILPKGYKMMSIMGYKTGDTLGPTESTAYDNGTRLKRPLQAYENTYENTPSPKRRNTNLDETQYLEEEYRKLNSSKQNDRKKVGIWHNMQKMAFELSGDADTCLPDSDPRDFNVLWRPYIREINGWQRQEPLVEEPTDDEEANGDSSINDDNDNVNNANNNNNNSNNNNRKNEEVQDRIEIESIPDNSSDNDDEELMLYQMTIDQRIIKLHIFLQYELYYCYYCGVQYKNEKDLHDNCPGLTEEDH